MTCCIWASYLCLIGTTSITISNSHHQFPKGLTPHHIIQLQRRAQARQYQEVVVYVAEAAVENNGDDDEDVVDDGEADDGEDDEALEDEGGDLQVREISASTEENPLVAGNRKVLVWNVGWWWWGPSSGWWSWDSLESGLCQKCWSGSSKAPIASTLQLW